MQVLKFIKKHRMFFIGFVLAGLIIIADQHTKRTIFPRLEALSIQTLGLHRHIQITPFFNLVMVWNKGVSFGMFNRLPHGQIILSAFTLAIIAFVIFLLWTSEKIYSMIYLSLILGGAIGNLIDRVLYGAVADFLDFHIGKYHWPAFNIADSVVCVGVAMILVEEFAFKLWNNYRKAKQESAVAGEFSRDEEMLGEDL